MIFFFLLLLLFPCRNGSGSSSGSREQSPTYQNWNHHSITNIKTKDNTITGGVSVVDASKKTNNSASDCTSSTECNSEGDSSDRNSDNNVYNVKAAAELGALSKRDAAGQGASLSIPTPAPRTTLEKSTKSSLQSSIRSMSVDRVKQVRHESLV